MTPPTIEALQDHAPFLQRLARSLLHDEQQAEDVVQETMAAALQQPAPQSLRSWLAAITRRLAFKRVRSETRRRLRETAVAQRGEASSTVDVVARLETQSRLVSAVQALPALYREVVVWRYFDDESPSRIAARTNVSVRTVETRLRRARAMLRTELDERHGGDGRAWSLALFALLPESRKALFGWTAATTTTGVFMTAKTSLAGGAIAAVTAFVLGWKAMPQDNVGPRKDTRSVVAADEIRRENDDLRSKLSAATAKIAELHKQLTAKPEKADAEEPGDSGPSAPTAKPEKTGPQFTTAELETVLASMDWEKIGESMSNMPPLLVDLLDALAKGEPMPENIGDIQRWNGPLITEALRAQKAGLGESGVNGAFTHPAVTVNTVFAALKAAKKGLNDDQARALQELGSRIVEEDRQRLAGYTDDTSKLKRLVEETDLKERLNDRIDEILTKEQRDAIRPESLRGTIGMDLYGASLVFMEHTKPVVFKDTTSFRQQLSARYSRALGADTQLAPLVREAVQRWQESLPPEHFETKLDRSGLGGQPRIRTEDMRRAAKAQLKLHEELAKLPLSEEQRKKLNSSSAVFLPLKQ